MYGYNQPNIDRINAQMQELEKIKQQLQQPQPITQNFQLAPSRDFIRYANSIEDVQRETVMGDTAFFSKDFSIVWLKNTKGDIKSYELTEILPKDSKDMQIELLQQQIDELKGMINNERINTNVNAEQITTNTTGNDETIGTTTKSTKSQSVSRVSTSKKR